MKPAEAPIITAITNGIGSTPSCCAAARPIGNISTAAALLVSSSVESTVTTYRSTSVQNGTAPAHDPSTPATISTTPALSMTDQRAKDRTGAGEGKRVSDS